MRAMFDKLAKFALLRGALFVGLGVLMLAAPESVMKAIVYVLAAYSIVLGILNIVAFYRGRTRVFFGYDFISGAMLILLGVVMIIFTKGILSVLPIFLGVLLILGGVARLIEALGGAAGMGGPRAVLLVLAVLLIAGGVVVIANPFTTSVILFQVYGALVVLQGISEVTSYFAHRKAARDSEEAEEDSQADQEDAE